MSVFYKLLKTTGGLPKNAEMKVVPVENATARMEQMSKNIEKCTTLTTTDLAGVLDALKNEMTEQLLMGNGVHLRVIGYFSLAIKGEVCRDARTHRYRLRHAKVRTVRFRPEKELLNGLSTAHFENATYRSAPHAKPTPAEVDAALLQLFAASPALTVSQLREHLHLSSYAAYRLAATLEKTGKVRNVGSPRHKVFVKGV